MFFPKDRVTPHTYRVRKLKIDIFLIAQILKFYIKLHVSQLDGLRAPPITIFGTQALDLRVNILVNVAAYPAILSCSRSQIVKIIADRRKMTLLVIMLKSIRSYKYTSELQRTCLLSLGMNISLQQTRQQTATAKNSSIFGKKSK